jgi:truncated hemoglobin YjbI
MMTMKLTKDILRKASDHLFYEIWMMNRLASMLEGQSNSLFASRLTSYTNTTVTTVFVKSTGIIKTSQDDLEEDDTRQVTNNAFIEAFGVHVRSLLDFFYAKGQDDDVVAAHFFASPSMWDDARPFKSKEDLQKIKNRINKEMAHLTYARQDVKSKLWAFKEIQDDLNRIAEVFYSCVPKDLLARLYPNEIRE